MELVVGRNVLDRTGSRAFVYILTLSFVQGMCGAVSLCTRTKIGIAVISFLTVTSLLMFIEHLNISLKRAKYCAMISCIAGAGHDCHHASPRCSRISFCLYVRTISSRNVATAYEPQQMQRPERARGVTQQRVI